jgi:hypothetical protein
MAKIAIEHNFGSPVVPLVDLSSPSELSVTNFGSAGATAYTYYVSALNSSGETLTEEISTSTGNASLSASNFNRVSWEKVWGATSYKIYNDSGLLGTTSNLHFDDTGGAATAASLPTANSTGYNPNFTSVGTLMYQQSGSIGPIPVAVARPMQQSTAITCSFPAVIPWSFTLDWVFLAEGSAAAATRRIVLYTFNRATASFTWQGFITLTFPTATNHIIRGIAVDYNIYTTGTVAVSGTAVTGTGTLWQTDRMCVGSRIGFGSTDPNQIGTWYEISAITNNTSITLTGSAGTINANSVYCIEDLRINVSTTNATTTNGGLFVAKGIRFENFTSGGTTILAAVTTDNIRAVYWLSDAAVVTNTIATGLALGDIIDWQTQNVYIVDTPSGSNVRCYVYNVRASLTGLASGKSSAAFRFSTGTQTVPGTAPQTNNGEIITTQQEHGAGVPSLYFVTTTRVCRSELSEITNGNLYWVNDLMVALPPGGASNLASIGALTYVEHLDFMDTFLLYSSGNNRSYVSDYNVSQKTFPTVYTIESKQFDSTLASSLSAPHPQIGSVGLISWNEEGMSYLVRQSTSLTLNQLYAVPQSACYTLGHIAGREQDVITPAIPTPANCRVYRVYANALSSYGGSDAFLIPPEVINLSYRFEGVADNTGAWIPLPDSGLISGTQTGQDIQFRIQFKVLGFFQLPSSINGINVVYETDTDIPSFLQWNNDDTSNTTGAIGFIQISSYGSVPDLNITFYRSDNEDIVFSQDSTVTTYGNFQFWNGSSWDNGLGTDTVFLRRRFLPNKGTLTGVNVYCKIKVI